MTSISALTPLLALQITARVPTADDGGSRHPFVLLAIVTIRCQNRRQHIVTPAPQAKV